MNRTDRRARGYRPATESLEARTVLSRLIAPPVELFHNVLFGTLGSQPLRPNTPVAPYAAASNPTFIDPSVAILAGGRIAVGARDYVAPYALLDARLAQIQVGSGTTVQDNARVVAAGGGIILGDNVYVAQGASVLGQSVVGGPAGRATFVGANAVVDNAFIAPGAAVGALARVGPGVTIPAGVQVLPGAVVTTQAQVNAMAPGLVARIPAAGTPAAVPFANLALALADAVALSNGYTQLYQGNSATGPSPGTTATTVFNGSLAPVEGASPSPGTPTLPAGNLASVSPRFPAPNGRTLPATDPFFPDRVIGAITFAEYPFAVARGLSRHDAIRADEATTVAFGRGLRLGQSVTIHPLNAQPAAPAGAPAPAPIGFIRAGSNLVVGDNAVLTASRQSSLILGDDVRIGAGAVVDGSTIGSGASIGQGAYVANSTVAPGQVVPPGTILVNRR